ncbi:unnamed protein product [Cuscuta campestris]|uniref:Leucine-rich repeat-containing N-terminal plant-type domain-containing protein n=1 Tax=Cuscuta campestris TaxID=132261 RepID=A0A484KW02_9ASTE|nr:unnamed protein product [Cuscuta campestris]
MESSSSSSSFYLLLLFIFSLSLISHASLEAFIHSSSPSSSSSLYTKCCRDDEMAALLQFKHAFFRTNRCWDRDDGPPKLESWKEGVDCCSWEGVECDEQDGDDLGHVVGLDLSRSCLYGSMNSNSSLFTLLHLQRLDLSQNDFNSSHIPSAIGNLSSLAHLNLFASSFSGQIPQPQLSNITTLVSLDLTYNDGLELGSLKGLVQHMINLKVLLLSHVNLSSSPLPHDLLSDSSSLESLDLSYCDLKGEFPAAIFNLPMLKMLDLSQNYDLKGNLPNFRSGSPLKFLLLSGTRFGGVLPPSIGNLASLEHIDISRCSFTGKLPMSLSNLTQLVSFIIWEGNHFSPDSLTTSSLSWIGKLTKLTQVYLGNMDLKGEIPSWLVNLTRLTRLDMSDNRLTGPIPSSFVNLTQLTELDMQHNRLTGPIPPSLMKLPELKSIDLSHNIFTGQFPSSFNHQIQKLNLSSNKLQGYIPTEITKLTYLTSFDVSFNNLSGPIPHGNQFFNYDCTSYEGNPGLYIEPWSEQCRNARSLQAPSVTNGDDDDDENDDEYDSESYLKMRWTMRSMGFACGLVVGVVGGNELAARKHDWFVKTFARKRR